MEEEKKVHKGLLGYKVYIKKWSEEAAVEVLSGLLADLAGYTEEEANLLLEKEPPILIVENVSHSSALNLAAALEIYGCTTDVYYKDEHIVFNDEVPQIFDENGALCESVIKSFQLISNKNRVNIPVNGNNNDVVDSGVNAVTDESVTTFGNYKLANENMIKNTVRRPVQHRILEDKPTGYLPAVPLDRPGRARRGCRGRGGRRNGQ